MARVVRHSGLRSECFRFTQTLRQLRYEGKHLAKTSKPRHLFFKTGDNEYLIVRILIGGCDKLDLTAPRSKTEKSLARKIQFTASSILGIGIILTIGVLLRNLKQDLTRRYYRCEFIDRMTQGKVTENDLLAPFKHEMDQFQNKDMKNVNGDYKTMAILGASSTYACGLVMKIAIKVQQRIVDSGIYALYIYSGGDDTKPSIIRSGKTRPKKEHLLPYILNYYKNTDILDKFLSQMWNYGEYKTSDGKYYIYLS